MPRQGDSTLVEVLLSQKCHFMTAVVPGFSTIDRNDYKLNTQLGWAMMVYYFVTWTL